jgi:hypothetical protein
LGSSLLAASPVFAQETASVVTSASTAEPGASVEPSPAASLQIPANLPVEFEFVVPISSSSAKNDQFFPIRVSQDVRWNGALLIPAGTMGQGQVVHAARSGWGGKAGELIVAARYIDIAGVHIPLRRFRMGGVGTGTDRASEAIAVAAMVPLAGFLMNGGDKEIAVGTRANAIVAADTLVTPPQLQPAPAGDQHIPN